MKSFCESLKSEFAVSKLSLSFDRPLDFVTFQCGRHPLYLIWSIFWSLYHLGWFVVILINTSTLRYLTIWGYLSISIYQWLDTVSTILVHTRHKKYLAEDYEGNIPWYQKAVWVFFNIVNGTAFMIFVVYWAVFGEVSRVTAADINFHGLNAGFAIVNLMVSAKPVQLLHVYQPMIFSVIYIIFSVIYQFSADDAIYPLLDWNSPGTAVAMSLPLALAVVPICYFLFYLLYLLRCFLAEKWCRPHDDTSEPPKVSYKPRNTGDTAEVTIGPETNGHF